MGWEYMQPGIYHAYKRSLYSPAASLLGAMDRTADPCEDFFQFACGNWNKQHMIPEDRSSISTFEVLSDQIQVILKGQSLTRLYRA
jgi:predicted metalloendopeptidase